MPNYIFYSDTCGNLKKEVLGGPLWPGDGGKHRAEHWVVVEGTALVEVEGETSIINENQSTYIPLGSKHRLSNPGKIPLKIVEVQSGAYLGEDDIERYEDNYGRTP